MGLNRTGCTVSDMAYMQYRRAVKFHVGGPEPFSLCLAFAPRYYFYRGANTTALNRSHLDVLKSPIGIVYGSYGPVA